MTMQILAFELDAPLYIYRWLKNNVPVMILNLLEFKMQSFEESLLHDVLHGTRRTIMEISILSQGQ